MSKQRKVYSREFKQEAVGLVCGSGLSVAAVARDLGVDQNTLRQWKRQQQAHGAPAFPGQGKSHDQELAQLRREVTLLRQERDILKKAVGYFADVPR